MQEDGYGVVFNKVCSSLAEKRNYEDVVGERIHVVSSVIGEISVQTYNKDYIHVCLLLNRCRSVHMGWFYLHHLIIIVKFTTTITTTTITTTAITTTAFTTTTITTTAITIIAITIILVYRLSPSEPLAASMALGLYKISTPWEADTITCRAQ